MWPGRYLTSLSFQRTVAPKVIVLKVIRRDTCEGLRPNLPRVRQSVRASSLGLFPSCWFYRPWGSRKQDLHLCLQCLALRWHILDSTNHYWAKINARKASKRIFGGHVNVSLLSFPEVSIGQTLRQSFPEIRGNILEELKEIPPVISCIEKKILSSTSLTSFFW